MKVQGACDKPFWLLYKRLNDCASTVPDSDYVLVEEEEVFYCAGHAKEATTKRHHCPARGGTIIQSLIYLKRLFACTSDLHHSTQRPERYKI